MSEKLDVVVRQPLVAPPQTSQKEEPTSADFATTKNGRRRSLASQIRFRKTLETTIPPTLLLDGRMAVGLEAVKEPKQKLEEIRSGPATSLQPEKEVRADARDAVAWVDQRTMLYSK